MKTKALILDLDGTIYIDGEPINNIVELLNIQQAKGVEIIFLTNNTSVSKEHYVEKLKHIGLEFTERDNLLTPIDSFLAYAKNTVGSCFYLLPERVISYIESMEGPTMNSDNPDLILVGFDKELTYKKLQKACELINSGRPFLITHIDLACPSKLGPIPDCGSISKLIEHTTGKKWEQHFGKPSASLAKLIKLKLGKKSITPDESVLIGDRYYTDIVLGNKIGAKTCHVQSGEVLELQKDSPDNYFANFEYKNACAFISDLVDGKTKFY